MAASHPTHEMTSAIDAFDRDAVRPAGFFVEPHSKSRYTLVRSETWPCLVHYEFRSGQHSKLFVELHAEAAGYAFLGNTFHRCAKRVGAIQGFPIEYYVSRSYPNYKKWPSLSIALPPNVDGSVAANVMREFIAQTHQEVEKVGANVVCGFIRKRSGRRKGAGLPVIVSAESLCQPTQQSENRLPAYGDSSVTVFDHESIHGEQMKSLVQRGGLYRFEHCYFRGNFIELNLEGFRFVGGDFSGAAFCGCKMSGTKWLHCRGWGAIFESAELSGATFTHCDLKDSQWRGAELGSVTFNSVNLSGAKFQEVGHLGLSFIDCALGPVFRGEIYFNEAVLRKLDFSEVDLCASEFGEAFFVGESIRDAFASDAPFEGDDLRDAMDAGLQFTPFKPFKGLIAAPVQAVKLFDEFHLRLVVSSAETHLGKFEVRARLYRF